MKKSGLTAQPEIKKVEIRLSHKYIIVGSDGFWDFIDIKEVQTILRQSNEAEDIARTLIKIAINNGSNDNVTIVVLKLN